MEARRRLNPLLQVKVTEMRKILKEKSKLLPLNYFAKPSQDEIIT